MIKRIEALNYRCLRYVNQELHPFQVLIGPNASGKSTFLDVVSFLGDLVTGDLDYAIEKRTQNSQDLYWMRSSEIFELAIELEIPSEIYKQLKNDNYSVVRYEIAIEHQYESNEDIIKWERVVLKRAFKQLKKRTGDFPQKTKFPKSVLRKSDLKHEKSIINRAKRGQSSFIAEIGDSSEFPKGGVHHFDFGPKISALRNIPKDKSKYPVTIWLKELFEKHLQFITLNSDALRKPGHQNKGLRFHTDGANLPWLIMDLKNRYPKKFSEWILHIQTTLENVIDIKTNDRPWEGTRYLIVCYKNGLEIPSWSISDGTLRLLALTIIPYIPDLEGIFLIEEPENGIHPKAVETMFDSLRSVYNAQVFLATHSPVILSLTEPEQILCFAKTEDGIVDVIRGSEHPNLRNWRHEIDLGTLFAGGVLE